MVSVGRSHRLQLLPVDLLVVLGAQGALILKPAVPEPVGAEAIDERFLEVFGVRDCLVEVLELSGDFDLALAAVSLVSCQVLASIPVRQVLVVDVLG